PAVSRPAWNRQDLAGFSIGQYFAALKDAGKSGSGQYLFGGECQSPFWTTAFSSTTPYCFCGSIGRWRLTPQARRNYPGTFRGFIFGRARYFPNLISLSNLIYLFNSNTYIKYLIIFF